MIYSKSVWAFPVSPMCAEMLECLRVHKHFGAQGHLELKGRLQMTCSMIGRGGCFRAAVR